MSIFTPTSFYTSTYAPEFPWTGRGALEVQVIQTLREWIVYYIAEYERQNGLPARSTPVPPAPQSISGGIDYTSTSTEIMPQLIVTVRPTGEVERYDNGNYGAWFEVGAAAVVYVEGDQNATRALADVYGTCLEALLPQQGAFGLRPDGLTDFATRTRLMEPYEVTFPNDNVRDIAQATLMVHTFLEYLVQDLEGPRIPPQNPYAIPPSWSTANKVETDLIRGTPDSSGFLTADAVILDGTVNPNVVTYTQHTVNEPADTDDDDPS